MKKFLIMGLAGIFLGIFSYIVGCSSKASPVTSTLPSPTPTRTNTPFGAHTATFTATPAVANFPVLYIDGSLSTIVTATNSFAGGGTGAYPILNATDTTVGGYNGDSQGYLVEWTSSEVSSMAGYSGFSFAGGSTNFTGYTTCTFWAKANQSASVGFNAAEPSGDTANVPESLTTTWTQFSLNIAPGTRSDGIGGAINAVTTYFVCVITSAPGSTPLYVSIDDVSFQTAGSTSTFTNTPTITPTSTETNTPNGTFTSTPTITNTVTNTPAATPYAIYNGLTNGGSGPFVGGNGANEFDSGGGSFTANNPILLTDTTFPYTGDTYDANWTMENCAATYYGWNLTGPSTNYTGCVNCTFYARTDRAYAGNGIEFFAAGGSNKVFAVTQTYTQFTYTFSTQGSSLTAVTVPFGWVIGGSDVTDLATAGNLNLYVDNVCYNL